MRVTIRIEDRSMPQSLEASVDGLEHLDELRVSDELRRLGLKMEREVHDRLKRDRLKWPELAPITLPRFA